MNFSGNLKVHNNQIYEDGMVFRFDSYDKTCSLLQIYTLILHLNVCFHIRS